jgi:catechol 2,3-dioxygenase-like lactoylglutathione lyase family enzyme
MTADPHRNTDLTGRTVEAPGIVGVHHVRLPVSEVVRSSEWYQDVFGFEPRLRLEEEDQIIGCVVGQRSGLTLGLHHAPALAQALKGFCSIALSVRTHSDLAQWCAYLDGLGVAHSRPAEGHLGWYVEVPDPDELIVQLHTIEQPTSDEA